MNPPESILHNTSDILNACELAEIGGAPSSDSSFVLVTQLSCLLLLGKYNHARHLWRRYSAEILADSEMQDSETTSSSSSSIKTGHENDLHQFRLLWNAVQPLLQSFFGQTSLLESAPDVYKSLQTCIDANLYPLSSYALELKVGIRGQMAELIERVYDSAETQMCETMLGREDGEDLDQYLLQRCWEKTNSTSGTDIWIPASRSPNMKSKGLKTDAGGSKESKIEFLSNVVGFMERQQVHL
mmetsp:Transcript_13845/g.17466  ORF Transcript_13845/g.17466 Transcript_13845/m.17466 type:complete len:242 (-) Transcript_13845:68-793(-)